MCAYPVSLSEPAFGRRARPGRFKYCKCRQVFGEVILELAIMWREIDKGGLGAPLTIRNLEKRGVAAAQSEVHSGKQDSMTHLILLSGGSGTRLWPLSNDSRSKQFLKVLRDAEGNHVSMVQRVFSQIKNVNANIGVTIAAAEAQRDSIARQLPDANAVVLEPERRDTAPAIMLACAHLRWEQHASLEDPVVVMPIDTYADQAYYDCVPKLAAAVNRGVADLVLMGVKPTYPSEKFGYIVPVDGGDSVEAPLRYLSNGARDVSTLEVARFTEKPSAAEAEDLMAQGALWNCGVFAFRLGYLMDVLSRYMDARSFHDVYARYRHLPKNSFDYEVVEKADSVAVLPYVGMWKDLGTWNTLADELADKYSGRVVVDEKTCENVHVVNETGLPMVVAGLKDAVVAATPDGILVTGKDAAGGIKSQVGEAAALRPMYERRRWGEYRVIDASVYGDGRKALTKELVLEPGGQLSYQKHFRRSEVWTVVSGTGEVVMDGDIRQVGPGDIVNVKIGQKHAARAVTEMHMIEVQLGDKLVEEDIERFGNYWDE